MSGMLNRINIGLRACFSTVFKFSLIMSYFRINSNVSIGASKVTQKHAEHFKKVHVYKKLEEPVNPTCEFWNLQIKFDSFHRENHSLAISINSYDA